MSFVEKTWDYVKRNKWPVVGVTSALGGAYVVYKFKPKLDEFWKQYKMFKALEAQMKSSPSAEQQALRRELNDKMERNMRVGDSLVKNFCASARTSIDEIFPIEQLRATMKKSASGKRTAEDLSAFQKFNQWAFARTIVGVYAVCILHFLVKVQLSVVSRYVSTDESILAASAAPLPPSSSTAVAGVTPSLPATDALAHKAAADQINTIFLNFAEFAARGGLTLLCDAVFQVVVSATSDIQLNQPITPQQLSALFATVRTELDKQDLMRFCLPEEKDALTALSTLPVPSTNVPLDGKTRLIRMWSELRQVLRTQSAKSVLQQSIDEAFDSLAKEIQPAWSVEPEIKETVPFVNLAARVAKVFPVLLTAETSWLVQQLSNQTSVPQLCSVIFFPLELTLSPVPTGNTAPVDDMSALLQLMNGMGATDADKEAFSALLKSGNPGALPDLTPNANIVSS